MKKTEYSKYKDRIKNELFPCYEPKIGNNEINNIKKVIKSNWISEGDNVRKFENKLAKICNRKYSSAFINATSAMISSFKSLNIGAGDEIIVPTFSHCADPNSIAVTGAKPIFSDVNENSMCLDLENIKKVFTKKTKAVLYVCAYGNMEGFELIEKFCKQKKIYLFNDCAPALFGFYKNKPIPSYGDCAYLSFFADKTITTGEGGMLLTNNKKIHEISNIFKHDGRKERGHDIILKQGYNFRFNEILAAIGLAQLNRYKSIVLKKNLNRKLYMHNLKNIKEIKFFQYSDKRMVPHRNIIFYKDAKKLISYLSSKGIGVRTLFMPMHSQPAYKVKKKFLNSMKIFKKGICLPSSPHLTKKQIKIICDTIKYFLKK